MIEEMETKAQLDSLKEEYKKALKLDETIPENLTYMQSLEMAIYELEQYLNERLILQGE